MWHTTGTSHRTLKDALCNCVVSLLLSEAAFCDLQILKKTRIHSFTGDSTVEITNSQKPYRVFS